MAKATRAHDKEARRQQQQELRRQSMEAARRDRRRRTVLKGAGIVAAVIVLAGAFVVSQQSGGSTAQAAVSSSLGTPTTDIPSPPAGQYKSTGMMLRLNGKPELLFVGALYCPFCASERWAIVKSLDQFGTWSNLHSSESASGSGGFALIPTYDLLHATYRSRYVSLVTRDIEDRASKPLQQLSPEQQNLFNRYDPGGGIPMVLVADHVMLGAGYQPSAIDGKSFHTVQAGLKQDARAGFVHDINAEANVITAYLCRADGGKPATACTRPAVKHILSTVK